MFRLIACAALVLVSASPVLANARQEEMCTQTSKIVFAAVTERAKGKSSEAVKRDVAKMEGAFDQRFLPAVGPVVDWVFVIPDSDIRAPDANESISARYRRECIAFKL